MSSRAPQELLLTVVVPAFNERDGLLQFHTSLVAVLERLVNTSYEIIYCDDGSSDGTDELVRSWHRKHSNVKLLKLARNFGKEVAVSAGLHAARGRAILTIDADGQHPVERIPDFYRAWQHGKPVVTGVRRSNQKEGFIKRYGSKLFYALFAKIARLHLMPGATDFRIIDRQVVVEFNRLTERRRITRGMIDWLGYPQTYIPFNAKARMTGQAGYSTGKLVRLAIDSVVSLSLSPLYITAYIGIVVLPLSILLGLAMIGNAIIGDPFQLDITGSAYIMTLMLFLVGILLVSQGIIGLYLSHIHTETQNRPLYIIDTNQSVGLDEKSRT